LIIVYVHQQQKHYVNIDFFLNFLRFDCCFFLADPYFENLHDPMEEPSAEVLVDEHQDAAYPTAKWKSKLLCLFYFLIPSTQRPTFYFE
jgi:hypothetical protein